MALNSERDDVIRTMPPQQPADNNGARQSGKQLSALTKADRVDYALDRLIRNASRGAPQMNEELIQKRISYGWKLYHLRQDERQRLH
jgi:hypothetical protein